MFATSFKLAALKVACPNDNLQLTATPTLTFLSSDPTINSLTQPQLCKDLRTATKVVKRGPGCRIYVEVECDGVLPEGDNIEILKERLGLAIWGAPWWSQLPISPVLQQLPELFHSDTRPFSIAIIDTLPNFLPENTQNASTSAQDVKVPSGIPVLQLQQITLALQFRSLVDNANSGQRWVPADMIDLSFEGILDDHEAGHDDCLLLVDYGQVDCAQDVERERESNCGTVIRPDDGDENSFLLDEDDSMTKPYVTADHSIFDSQESVQTQTTLPDDRPEESLDPELTISGTTARLLTDVAMRTLLGGGQAGPTEGAAFLRPLPRHTMAALMPLIFGPCFSETMSQRSRFVPTITSTITSLAMTAQSPSLKSKLAKLASKGSFPGEDSSAGSVQARTYRIMHTSLFSAKSARKLLVARVQESRGGNREEDSMIIDGASVSAKNSGIAPTEDIVDMDFDDILDDEPLSEDEVDMLLDLEIMRQGLASSCSILLSVNEDESHIQGAESQIDLEMKDAQDEVAEAKDDSILEMSEKSFNAPAILDGLVWGNADMLF